MNIASFIDHTLLKPNCLESDILRLCDEAMKNGFFSVCVPPTYVATAKRLLLQKTSNVCTVIGFPFGYDTLNTKVVACKDALEEGADEIDMVMNISTFKSGKIHDLYQEVEKLSLLCHKQNVPVKVIIETAYLNREEIRMVCGIAVDAGADFIKTSTGYAEKGATVEDVLFLREILPSRIKIKASGGIKTFEQAQSFLDAGADRLGTSNGIHIISQSGSLSGHSLPSNIY